MTTAGAHLLNQIEGTPQVVFPSSRERNQMHERSPSKFQLCFRPIFQSGRNFVFPCDRQGNVDLDGMSETTRNNYLFARAMIGRDLAAPAIEAAEPA
jgi:hypothetical protein